MAHLYILLVAAETARVLGQKLVAMDYYDASIESAKTHGYLHSEALANELAAKFYLSIHKEKLLKPISAMPTKGI